MEKYKISVIVPIYNVDAYLPNCVNSIINQTYKNLEIILVDDGCTDKCGILCDKYKKEDKRIKVIHCKKNKGPAASRNKGLDICTGDYIFFVDSDDYINKYAIESLYNNLILNDADISMGNICFTKNLNEDTTKKYNNKTIIYTKEDCYKKLYTPEAIKYVVVWNKLYKRSMFDKLRFNEAIYYEDEAIIQSVYQNINKLVYTDAKYNFYYQRDKSIIHTYDKHGMDGINVLIEREKFLKDNNLNYLIKDNNYLCCFVSAQLYNRINDKNYLKDKPILKKYIKEYGDKVLSCKDNSLFQKTIVRLIKINPYNLKILQNIKHIFNK